LECLFFFVVSSATEGVGVASAFAFAFGTDIVFAFAAGIGFAVLSGSAAAFGLVVGLATGDLATGTPPMVSMVALPPATSTLSVFSVLDASTETEVIAFEEVCADFMAVGLAPFGSCICKQISMLRTDT
jgi:hypothetical protein